ncbi:MAG: hypothetical protein GY806_18410 [Gammaproteobacteria bacterium]|nr:hypothetical protein [Gammaproteobacteria bacterium]
MMNWEGLHITDGIGQQDRPRKTLAADYFNVDELTFEEMLAMGVQFAKHIHYYNLANETDGNWGELLQTDEAVIMATILCIDLQQIESDFLSISYTEPDKTIDFMLSLAMKIDHWYTALVTCQEPSADLLARKLTTIIHQKLSVELQNLYEISNSLETSEALISKDSFSAIWRLEEDNTRETSQNAANVKQSLQQSFYRCSHAISFLKTDAEIALRQSMKSRNHNPSTGLFMVFLELFKKVQAQTNTFTLRHLQFYYDTVLNIGSRKTQPENYHLLLQTLPGCKTAQVEKGSVLSAGKDAEFNDIIFTTDNHLHVSDTRIDTIATLCLQQDHLISPETEIGAVTRIKSDIRTNIDSSESDTQAWPLFGVDETGSDNIRPTDTRMGFTIASPILHLEQGVRKIDIQFEVNFDSTNSINPSKKSFEQRFGSLFTRYLLTFKGDLTEQDKDNILTEAEASLSTRRLDEIRELLQQDWQGLFYKLFKNIFSLKLTTKNGWLNVESYIVSPLSEDLNAAKPGFEISLSLGPEVDAIAPYDPAIHGGEFETGFPLFECLINPQSSFYPYSLFQGLIVQAIDIDVDVRGVKNILTYNQHGQLDPSKPFQPFGPVPGNGAYFIIGNYEIAQKRLTALDFNLTWGELPSNLGGFETYYQGYHTAFDNDTFEATVSILADGRWLPEASSPTSKCHLFETENSGGHIASDKKIPVEKLGYARPIDQNIEAADFRYDLATRAGFFKIAPCAPESIFGHGEYGQLLSHTLTLNARLKKPKAVPNPPYTPVLNSISLCYKASTRIVPTSESETAGRGAESLTHIHPFGIETIYLGNRDTSCYLIPQYEHHGTLFVGLSGSNIAGALSLFFNLSQQAVKSERFEQAAFDWFFLASNDWQPIHKNNILSDTTHGFLTSGIVTLNIPTDISRHNTVMPKDLFWLRVSTNQTDGYFPHCHSVELHAIKVTGFKTATEVPNWTPVQRLTGIGSIKQGNKGFDGLGTENITERKTRISERLRHKNRALLPKDYEQLILQKYPDILKVKCFSHMSSIDNDIKPGQVLIVVIPDTQTKDCSCRLVHAYQLNDIKDYVKSLCSPFVNIEIRNPLYEQIQVRCTVKFTDAISGGIQIQHLNQHISDYICPWKPSGYQAKFGWSIRQQDIESFIRSLAYVDFITNFSMLHITQDRFGKYSLFDTVAADNAQAIHPRYPWSLAMPTDAHFIETIAREKAIKAEITGIDELAIGGTFIISGHSRNGKEE